MPTVDAFSVLCRAVYESTIGASSVDAGGVQYTSEKTIDDIIVIIRFDGRGRGDAGNSKAVALTSSK